MQINFPEALILIFVTLHGLGHIEVPILLYVAIYVIGNIAYGRIGEKEKHDV